MHDNPPDRCRAEATIGLNPHSDTPVEILHVILLGIIKYFWRDAIKRMDDKQKATLKTRIASFNTTGLAPGVSHLAAATLVDYAGSLVGRDFRLVVQFAPFVLVDLVEPTALAAWIALGSVVRMTWQPEIDGVDEYMVSRPL